MFNVLEVIFSFSYKMSYILASILTLEMYRSTYTIFTHSMTHLLIYEINTIISTIDIKINRVWDLPSRSLKLGREDRYI